MINLVETKHKTSDNVLNIFIVLVIITSLISLYFFYDQFKNYSFSMDVENWGQFGDYVGGTLNPLMTLITILLLLKELKYSRKANEHMTKELKDTNKIHKENKEINDLENALKNIEEAFNEFLLNTVVQYDVINTEKFYFKNISLFTLLDKEYFDILKIIDHNHKNNVTKIFKFYTLIDLLYNYLDKLFQLNQYQSLKYYLGKYYPLFQANISLKKKGLNIYPLVYKYSMSTLFKES